MTSTNTKVTNFCCQTFDQKSCLSRDMFILNFVLSLKLRLFPLFISNLKCHFGMSDSSDDEFYGF